MRRCKFNCDLLCNAFGILVVLMGFYAFGYTIFLFIFLPEELKITITDASLTEFNYTSAPNSTLKYSLALDVTVRNPNRRIGVYFRRVQIIPHYQNKRFSLQTLNSSVPFYLGHKNTTVLAANNIRGQQLLLLNENDVRKYNSETSLGFYSIDVKLGLRVRIRYGKIKTSGYKPRLINCQMKIPLSNSNNGYRFNATECWNVYVLTRPSDYY